MMAGQSKKLEALVYSQNPSVAARCAEVLSELPVDWMILQDAQLASSYLLSSSFDLVLLDLDSSMGEIILSLAWPVANSRRNGVVFGITEGAVDGDLLRRAYDSLVFYPVRLADVESELHRAIPLAEQLMASRMAMPALALAEVAADEHEKPHGILSRVTEPPTEPVVERHLQSTYALSIAAQEKAASLISAAGTIWYVHEITKDWSKLSFLLPPTPGPLELIGISILFWLCAKHRRYVLERKEDEVPASVHLIPAPVAAHGRTPLPSN